MLKIWEKEGGFTLIEMVVVLVLIAVLAAVAIPIYAEWKKRSRCSEAYNLLGGVVSHEMAYYEENGVFDTTIGSQTAKAKWFTYTATGTATSTVKATGETGTDTAGAWVQVVISPTAADVWTADETICKVPANLN